MGIFANWASLVRMVATLPQEQDDEWQVASNLIQELLGRL